MMTTTGRAGTRVHKRTLFRQFGYEPHAGQERVHRSIASRRVVACGARWGKTTMAAMEVVAALLEPARESRGWVVGPTLDLAQRIFRQVEYVLRDKLSHRILRVEPREHSITIRNLGGGESMVRAKSSDFPASLLGEELDWLVIDEAARLRDDIWSQFLSQRLLDRDGWALMISTPNGCNWFHQVFELGRKGTDAAFESFTGPTADNPHVNLDLIEAERGRMNREKFQQEYEAKFLGADVIPCESCGGPTKGLTRTYVVQCAEDEPLSCPECALPTRPDGTSLVHLAPSRARVLAYTRLEERTSTEAVA